MRRAFHLAILGFVGLIGCTPAEADPDSSVPPPPASTTVTSSPIISIESTVPAPAPILVTVVDPSDTAVVNAVVRGRPADSRGSVLIERSGDPIIIEAIGFVPRFLAEPSAEELVVVLEPVVLRGVVETAASLPYAGVTVSLGDAETVTDASGEFEFTARPPGELVVELPARATVRRPWLGRSSHARLVLDPIPVRALHVTGWAVADPDHWQRLLDLAAQTEINGLVVDLKDESGRVFYPSAVEMAGAVGATGDQYLLDDVVETVDREQLYLIGRIVLFQDPIAARANPDMAVWDSSRAAPFKKNSQYFLDPTDLDARQYGLDLAVEACDAGFDEIQFDYVRYPDGFGASARFDGGSDEATRREAIRSFLEEASLLLRPRGCAVAADIFGFITSTTGDGGIGQHLETLAPVVDVLSPMLYPSHYSEGWFGFAVPNDHPGPVVAAALDDALARLSTPVVLRPWIQDFYYSDAQVRQEIAVSEARGLGWMLWNALSRFADGALLPAG